jgi:hypothetical protein
MVPFTSIAVSAAVVAALSSTSVNAIPTFEKRIVGTLSCKVVKTGTLQLYNSKTKATYGASFANDYRLNDLFTDGAERPASLEGVGNPKLLSSYKGLAGESVEFLACTESQTNGFEDFSPYTNGSYYGHISPTKKTKYCANHLQVYGDAAYLAAEECSYSDDSGNLNAYFTYTPSNSGQIDFLGYTGPEGGYPTHDSSSVYDFGPGSKKAPAVYVHDGSAAFSNWVLQLK